MFKATVVSTLLFLSAITAACGGSDATDATTLTGDSMPVVDAAPPTPDAPAVCPNNPLPATADNPVTISGGVYTLGLDAMATPVADASLTVFDVDDSELATATSDASGDFAIALITDGVPVDGYVEVTSPDLLTTRVYPPAPIAANQPNVAALMLTPDNFQLLNELLLGETQDPGNAWIAVLVLDPAGNGIPGATVSVSPGAGAVHYNVDGFPSKTAEVTGDDGIAYLVNVPPGPVSVTATSTGSEMRPSEFTAIAGVLNTTGVVACTAGAQ